MRTLRICTWALAAALLLTACGGSRSSAQTYQPKEDEAAEGRKKGVKAPVKGEKEAKPIEKEEPLVQEAQPVENGILLRLKRNPGKVLVYEGSFDRVQKGNNKATESASFYISIFTAEKDRANPSLDLVAIRRTYLDRKRIETTEQGKTVDKILPLNEDLIELGPNFKDTQGLRCYGMDGQNNIAQFYEDMVLLEDGAIVRGKIVKKTEHTVVVETNAGQRELASLRIKKIERVFTPHLLMYDTPHYLFPIFSSKPVQAGSAWSYTVQMVIPMNQGGGGIMPTQFGVKITGKLRAIQGSKDEPIAIVDYTAAGEFDSSKEPYSDRFSEAFRERNRIIHSINANGTVTLDVKQGVILEKLEDMNVHIEASSVVPVAANKPPENQHSVADIVSRFKLKWLPPGTKLKSGVAVPPSE